MDLNLNLILNEHDELKNSLTNEQSASLANLNNYLNEYDFNCNDDTSSLVSSRSSTTATNTTLNDKSTANINEQPIALSSKIKYLEEELSNAQADKEFVWSLWRQLQVSNPDVTSAIGFVVQREKEKSELKDRKVLEILKIKDKKLEDYEKTFHNKHSELVQLIEKIKNLDSQLQLKEEELIF